MYTVKKIGVAGIVGVSLVFVSTGFAASTPNAPVVANLVEGVSAPRMAQAPIVLSASIKASSEILVTPDVLQKLVAVRIAAPKPIAPSIECMAKVVYHEAANQALPGQLAVAQVIMNRAVGGPIFPRGVCAVVNQTGQFFKTRRFRAPRNDVKRWRTALAIAMVAQEERLSQVAPGALFYHAAYVRPSWSHQHERIAQIGDQVFYR